MNDIDAGRHPRSSTGDLYRKGNRLWNHLQRRTMEGKTVLTALVTGTVNPKDAKDSEVGCSSFLDLTSSCLKT